MSAAKRNMFAEGEFGQYLDCDGLNVHYYEEGYGTPVIFVHGIGQSIYTFRNNIEDFAACFRVIVPDLMGHGSTDGSDGDYLIEDYSEFLLSFMNALNIDSANIVGFSTGGVIAMDFALAFPERVKKLVLLSPGGPTENYPSQIRNMTIPIISDISFITFSRNTIRNILNTAYFDKTLVTDEMVDVYYEFLHNKYARDAVYTTLNNWDDSEVHENMGAINCPIYIFWGENDQWNPLEYLESFEDAIPNVYAATVRNGGHMLHEEKYREINRKAIELLLTDEIV